MPRSPYQKRVYIVQCSICGRWCPVPTLEHQRICKEAGSCLDCMANGPFRLRVQIAAVEEAIAWVVRRGKAAPEEKRGQWRAVYTRKVKQLARLKERLEAMT
jgi:hypothetical protein